MKAIELATKLLENKDFDVFITIFEPDNSLYGASLNVYEVDGIADVGHSEKKIILSLVNSGL